MLVLNPDAQRGQLCKTEGTKLAFQAEYGLSFQAEFGLKDFQQSIYLCGTGGLTNSSCL